jgi:hypothetical protein
MSRSKNVKILSSCGLLLAASLSMSRASFAEEDDKGVYHGAACQPYGSATTLQYTTQAAYNTSSTNFVYAVCPATRMSPLVSGQLGARVWVYRGNVTTKAISCTFAARDKYGSEVDYYTRSSSSNGYQELQLFDTTNPLPIGTSVSNANGESLSVWCTLPAGSYIFGYQVYDL